MTETLDLATTETTDASLPGAVACALYSDGRRVRDIPAGEIGIFAGREGGIVWLGLHEPDEASLLLCTARQNDIVKKLGGWAAILAVPTAIAGIYGMNFKYMPEPEWSFGYPFAYC